MKRSAFFLETRDVGGFCCFCLNSDKLDELLGFRGVAEQMLAIHLNILDFVFIKSFTKSVRTSQTMAEMCEFESSGLFSFGPEHYPDVR